MRKYFISLFLIIIPSVGFAEKADLIVFSFDRPLQLYALLESVEFYFKNVGDISVIYRASNGQFNEAYNEVARRFSQTVFFKQGDQPKTDFKPLVLNSLSSMSHEYVLFAVDDIIAIDYIDIAECIECIEKANAYAFYLRLGKNITYCYMLNTSQRIPTLHEVDSGVYEWKFAQSQHDWGYPNTVDMTIYRRKDIEKDLHEMNYHAPNSFEGAWYQRRSKVMQKTGLCFARSKIVNLPLNVVQTGWHNRHANFASVQELLKVFEQGLKIDIRQLYKLNNNSPHMAYSPSFVARRCDAN